MESKALRFALSGIAAAGLSLFVYLLVRRISHDLLLATLMRQLVFVPVLYLGCSRFVEEQLLNQEQRQLGFWKAERRMLGRVGVALLVSTAVKALIEPWLAAQLLAYPRVPLAAAPLICDLVPGPVVNFGTLQLLVLWRGRPVSAVES